MQNEPNSRPSRYPTIPLFYHSTIPIRCQSCETNPISAEAGRWDRPIVRNEPNLPGPIVRNKPNFRRKRRKGKYCAGKELW